MEDSGALVEGVWPVLEQLARPAREKRRLGPALRDQLIIDLCAQAPLSVRELAQLLKRTEAYVGDAIRPLVEQQRLTFFFPDQPRHPKQRYLTPGSAAAEFAERIRKGEAIVPSMPTASGFPVEPTVASHPRTATSGIPSDVDLAGVIWPQLEQLSVIARERKRLAPSIRDGLVLELCSMAPLSARELGILLHRSEAYVADTIHPLVASGELGFLFPDQPRHPRQKYVSRVRKPLEEILEHPSEPAQAGWLGLADNVEQQRLQNLAQVRWSELEQIARPARVYRYLGGVELANLILAIARIAPVSTGELAILTDRREEYIREVLENLEETKKLRLLFPEQPHHGQQKYLAAESPSRAVSTQVENASASRQRLRRSPAISLAVELPAHTLTAKVDEPPLPPIQPEVGGLQREEAVVPRSRIGQTAWNAATNSIATVITGIVLGILMPRAWWLFGLLIAAGLATLHVVANSSQYQRYLTLDQSRSKGSFILLKGLVSYVEIVVVAGIIALIR